MRARPAPEAMEYYRPCRFRKLLERSHIFVPRNQLVAEVARGAGRRGDAGGFAFAARALRSRNYRLYAGGNAISLIGTWLQRVAVGWLAWQLTHSGTWLGLVAAADLCPTVVLSPLAGILADRGGRLRVIWATQLIASAQSVLLAVLVAADALGIEGLFAMSLLLGAANAINQPARLALVPSLVEREALASAVAINSITFNGARFIGPALAGVIIAEGSIALAFAVNAATFIVFMVALMGVSVPPEGSGAAGRAFFADTFAGYSYAMRHPGIGPVLLLMTATALFARGFSELLPGFADAVFGRGAQGLAWLTAMVGLGAVAGGLFMAHRSRLEGLTRVLVANVLVLIIALLGFTATASYWIALPCLFLAGLALVSTGIAAQTLVQHAIIPEMRGRVMALYGMIFRAGPAFGTLLMGALSGPLGLRLPVALGALLCAGAWFWARLRRDAIAAALETS
jgi:MFS family permease